jgi:hypothetical protein
MMGLFLFLFIKTITVLVFKLNSVVKLLEIGP